ncbi:MAG: M1 family aminopeptidase [Acidimicrobiales bacterium]
MSLSRDEAEARARVLTVASYDVLLDFAREPNRVCSRSEVRFECREGVAETFAQLAASEFRRIELNGSALDPAEVVMDGRLVLGGVLAENVLVVEAVHDYRSDGRGFARFTDALDGSQYALAYSYPLDAPSVFCCFDQPDLRAEVTLSIVAPTGWECISHTVAEQRPSEGSAGLWRFAPVPSMKPQELTVCLGPYVTVLDRSGALRSGDPQIRVSCRRSLVGWSGADRVADLVGRAVRFYGELFGVACPYDLLEVVFVPELTPLAVLMPGLIGLNESLLSRISDPDDDFVTMVVGHEVAHLWFGCLVEGRWWDDLWLSEALATWASYVGGDEVLGMGSAWAEFSMRDKAGAYAADRLPTAEAVASPVDRAADALARPSAITYSKGASVLRQLGALIGERALREGIRRYLSDHAHGSACLEDIVRCWSDASGSDLSGWAESWLATPGVNLLRPEITIAMDGSLESLSILQEPPDVGKPPRPLRTHRVGIGLYDLADGVLRLRAVTETTLTGPRSLVHELTGGPAPAAVVVNHGDSSFARTRFDERSLRSLTDSAMDVGDPVAEAVLWHALWDMTTLGELPARDLVDVVSRRLLRPRLPVAVPELVSQAVAAAEYYAPAGERSTLRAHLAAACQTGLDQAPVASREWRDCARGLARAAETDEQLTMLELWLGSNLADRAVDLDTERQALETLAVHDRLHEGDVAAFVAIDPVGGEATRATCEALRPDRGAKERAWLAALDPEEAPRMALAHARGVWVPGQEVLTSEWAARYFTDAVVTLSRFPDRHARRLAEALYPTTIIGRSTVTATDATLARRELSKPVRAVLTERRTILSRMLAARGLPAP